MMSTPTRTQTAMIETRVRIVHAGAGTAWVEPTEQAGCQACHVRSACNIGGLGLFLQAGRKPVVVACNVPLQVGDELVVAIPEADLLKAGLLAYVLPVVLAVLGAGLAALGGQGDVLAALAMLAGMAAGLVAARHLGRTPTLRVRHANDFNPTGEAT